MCLLSAILSLQSVRLYSKFFLGWGDLDRLNKLSFRLMSENLIHGKFLGSNINKNKAILASSIQETACNVPFKTIKSDDSQDPS